MLCFVGKRKMQNPLCGLSAIDSGRTWKVGRLVHHAPTAMHFCCKSVSTFLKWKDPEEGRGGSPTTLLWAILVAGLVLTPQELTPDRVGPFSSFPSLTICPSAGLSILARLDLQRNREWFWRLAQGELLMA